jgi:hypothetical protein
MDGISTYSCIILQTWKNRQNIFNVLQFLWKISTYRDIIEQDMESEKKNMAKFRPNPNPKLVDQVRKVLRYIYHFGSKTHLNQLGAKSSPLANIYPIAGTVIDLQLGDALANRLNIAWISPSRPLNP